MAKLDVCPDHGTLQYLLLGRLSADEAAALDEHLLACEPCGDLLRRLVESDSFASAARAAGEQASPADNRVLAAIARWREVTLPAKAIEETLARRRDHTTDAWDLEKLLDPPQAEGELGRFGGYRVLRVLGAGGMGLVLDAEDPQLRRRVALKVMQRSLAAHEENRQRFLREARATAAIEHAHIVTVFQVGEHNGLPFLAMQLLKGESLQDRLERATEGSGFAKGSGFRVQGSEGNGLPSGPCGVPGAADAAFLPLPPGEGRGEGALQRSEVGHTDGQPVAATASPHPNPLPEGEGSKRSLPLSETLRIGREIAEALAEAHSRKLIHRDIKPANIWLEGASGWVKLVDFGLAHAAEDVHLTQTGAILGTPAYMSPEQARGETVDGRTDLYSLGAVLYKLTTGEVPFRGASTMAVLMALATETPRPPVELNPGIPPALNDLILRLLAKKPVDRYESAAAVAEAIRQIETSRVGIAHHEPEGEPSADVPVRRRPRWPLVAAAAAAAFLLAAIVIIVRDKDGKEVFRATVPDSGSVTLTEGNAAAKATPPLDDGSAIPPPADITEPPPLEEWLKGRTVLTVAQDGSGKFKTIQSALDALQAGQVVKVLDRGPYREQLNARVLPADTGLVSEVSAVIELPEYRLENKGSPSELEVGHFFREMDGFHLAGFKLVFPGQEHFRRCGLYTVRCEGLVLEHCWLHGLRGALQARVTGHAGDGDKPVCIRECLIEGALDVGSVDNEQAAILVARNLFVGPDGANAVQALLAIGKAAIYRYVGIRGNVFASPKDGLALHDPKHLGRLEITNNTFLGSNPISWFYFDDNAVPAGQAIIANNLRLRPGLLALLLGSTPAAPDRLAQIHDAAGRSWHVAHNCYPRELRSGDSDYQASVVKFPGDILGAPRLISMAADNRDYLRPESGDSIATAGAGGELPSYIGALPPGPAPKEGDWFTRLRERWTDAGWASPTTESTVGNARPTIAEPPPLEEWLKGRAVLTVAQDGSGQFKTIQEAINALKPHQVVKVLDRGPYRESIRTAGLPDDTGLISDQQATVETLAWPEGGIAHLIGPVEKFRLAGIRFVAPRRDSWGAIVLWAEPSGLVIEDCCFALAVAQHPTQSVAALYFAPEIEAPDKSPIVVHNCLFEFALLEIAGGVRSHPTFIVERNYFRKSGVGLGRRLDQAVFRHNVFDGAKECFWIYELSDVTRALEISNNTAATGVSVVHAAPPRGVLLRNNITEHDVAVDGEVYKFRAEIVKNWQRDHSSYLRRSLLAKSPTDVTVEPAYLSSDPADRNYLRIPADGPQAVGGAGGDLPSYMGALPPGPAPKEGDWFTRLQARWTTGGQASSAVESEVGDARPTIAEPPPLEEWLKGRTVLTVAQDGSGQFKTIQAALDALKAHQVVEVLDAGPYRETLRCFGLPLDTALVSRRQTTIEMPDEQGEPHYLHQSDGFRLSGFRFFSSPRQQWSWPCLVTCGAVTNLAVEDCHFVWKAPRDPRTKPAAVHIAEAAGARPSAASVVRHCVFDSASLALAGNADGNSKGSLRVEHNYFRNTYIFRAGKSLYQLLIRHNAIEAGTIEITELEDVTGILEISNNTVTGSDWSFNIRGAAPKRGLIIRNNISQWALALQEKLRPGQPEKNWRMDHNNYQRLTSIPQAAGDLLEDPQFLSTSDQNRDYLRIPSDGPLAHGGAGGDWPSYMGAFPPGPAPKEGDWFTRLRERWTTVGWALPTVESKVGNAHPTITEPPTLEEWLKGREALTVAQDGSGQFKTIQAAIDALQPGQVVKVLDAGPYRERLEKGDPPQDSGIVSESGAVVELPEYAFDWKDEKGNDIYKGHRFTNLDGFRVAGFMFRFPPRTHKVSYGLWFNGSGGLVLERCWVRSPVQTIVGHADGANARLACVRECRIDDGMAFGSYNEQAETLVTRNFFAAVRDNEHGIGVVFKQLAFRGNVFVRQVAFFGTKKIERFEMSNNTFVDRRPLGVPRDLTGELVFCNNLRLGPGLVVVGGDASRRHFSHNAYPRRLNAADGFQDKNLLPRAPEDVIGMPKFISKAMDDRDYLRPVAEDPIATRGAGGDWPSYIGAFPPGPAPKDGDWFTRLQSRWTAGGEASPTIEPKVGNAHPTGEAKVENARPTNRDATASQPPSAQRVDATLDDERAVAKWVVEQGG